MAVNMQVIYDTNQSTYYLQQGSDNIAMKADTPEKIRLVKSLQRWLKSGQYGAVSHKNKKAG